MLRQIIVTAAMLFLVVNGAQTVTHHDPLERTAGRIQAFVGALGIFLEVIA